ncbi:MAG: T9SS type A sorting domain-containing protein [Bacteroidia bacterium]|nr:T9SS type A sorting domain-containing protein [Bacteroidia bacterium]
MKKICLLILLAGMSGYVFGQKQKTVVSHPGHLRLVQEFPAPIPLKESLILPTEPIQSPPVGTSVTDAVTSIKIAETSNAYSTLIAEVNPLQVVNGVGNGGVLLFMHRQNINVCGGTSADNGRVRYVFSDDGGTSWDVGSGVSVSSGNLAPPGHCFGVMDITPGFTFPVRYPQGTLFMKPGGSTLEDMVLTHLGSILTPGPGGQWDGAEISTVTGALGNSPSITQEDYSFTNVGHEINTSFVPGKPGEFWFVTKEANGPNNDPGIGRIFLYKGVYDPVKEKVSWGIKHTFFPDHYLLFDNAPHFSSPSVAFSPDGVHGYVSWLGDLNGGEDTVLSPIIAESHDSGNTWSTPVEINLNSFPEVADSMQWLLVTDTTGGILDTIPFATGKATIGFEHDLVVGADGNPYMVVTIGPASHINAPEANYGIFSGLYLFTAAITRDLYGDYNILHLASQSTFRAYWGDLTQPATVNVNITQDIHPQASRTDDGSIVFFSWTDTDTTNGWSPLPGPPGSNSMTNFAPNLLTRAYDVNKRKLTRVQNWTNNDLNWGGRVVLPKLSPNALESGNDLYTLPVVITNIDGGNANFPCSYYYFSDIVIDASVDFTEDPDFFYNCKENPFVNVFQLTEPSCLASDGSVSIIPGGGLGNYSYQWDAAAGNSTDSVVSGLPSGIYSVVVSDEFGCTDAQALVLNNSGSPVLTIDSTQLSSVSCYGANDGSVCVTGTGGTGLYSWLWSNGETDSCANALIPGVNLLTVTDNAGCKSFVTVVIEEPDSLTLANLSVQNLLCNGDNSGVIAVSVSGGTGALIYNWNDGQTGPNRIGLAAGTYDLTVTDVNSCTLIREVIVNEPDTLKNHFVINDNTTPNPPYTGNATVNLSGGTAPYSVAWTDDGGNFLSNGQFVFGLLPGLYVADILDNNGCVLRDTAIIGGINSLTPESVGINVFTLGPNPTEGRVHFRLVLNQPDQVEIRIRDIQGRLIDTFSKNHTLEWEQTLDLGPVSVGIYLFTVTTSRGTIIKRLAID